MKKSNVTFYAPDIFGKRASRLWTAGDEALDTSLISPYFLIISSSFSWGSGVQKKSVLPAAVVIWENSQVGIFFLVKKDAASLCQFSKRSRDPFFKKKKMWWGPDILGNDGRERDSPRQISPKFRHNFLIFPQKTTLYISYIAWNIVKMFFPVLANSKFDIFPISSLVWETKVRRGDITRSYLICLSNYFFPRLKWSPF